MKFKKKSLSPKIDNLYQDIFDEVSVQLGLKEAMNNFHTIQSNYIGNLEKYFHQKCKKEFEWIENNSISKTLHHPKDSVNEEEFKRKKEELSQCITNNDHGYIDALEDFKGEYKKFNKEINKHVQECCLLKDDKKVKDCIREKYAQGATNLIGLFNKYEKKYNELNNKILL